jgi:hypothetical protein
LIDTTADMGDAPGDPERRRGTEARAAAQGMLSGDAGEPAIADYGHLVGPAYVDHPAKVGAVPGALGRGSFN